LLLNWYCINDPLSRLLVFIIGTACFALLLSQELFLTQLLPDRKLKVLESQPLGQQPTATAIMFQRLTSN
jgi:hypothetical protein